MELVVLIFLILIIGFIGKNSSSNNNNDIGIMKNDSTDSTSFDINPSNGNMMIGGIGGVDTFGNTFGNDDSHCGCNN